MFKKILVPVDLTERSQDTVKLACELAVQSEAEVVLLHVVETIEHIPFDELKPFYERLETSARQGLEETAKKFGSKKVHISQVVVYGHRVREIVDQAIDKRVDLIIMASHRVDPEHPGREWTTISYSVAILAPCPVLLVK